MIFLFFLVFVVTRRRPQLWITQSLMFTRQMLLKPKHTDNFKDIVYFIVCKMYFSYGFIEAFDSKGSINTLKKVFSFSCVKCILLWFYRSFDLNGLINTLKKYYVSHEMRWPCNFHFRYVYMTDRFCLLCKIISPAECPLSFLSIFCSFRQENRIVELFYWSAVRDRKENEIFASQAKNALKQARIKSLE